MTISIGYGVLIHHLPPAAAQTRHWQHQCSATGELTLTATGTVHSKFKQLESGGNPALADSLNLYPGTALTLPFKQLNGEVDGEKFSLRCH